MCVRAAMLSIMKNNINRINHKKGLNIKFSDNIWNGMQTIRIYILLLYIIINEIISLPIP